MFKNQTATLLVAALAGGLSCAEPPRESPPTAGAASSASQSTGLPAASGLVTVDSSSPYYARLAAVDAHSNQVRQESIDAIQRYTAVLERICPDSPERIGDMLIAGQREIRAKGKETTLRQLAADVSTMLAEAERSGGIPSMSSCAEPIALWVVGKH